MSKQRKMMRDTVPDDFSLPLAVTDFIPVFFFWAGMLLIGKHLSSMLFSIGACVCLLSGLLKVLWKIIVVLKKKNIWPLFIQMRILMPLGFLMMLIGLIISRNSISLSSFCHSVFQLPSGIFFAITILGMILMSVFAVKLDSSDSRNNWLEEITNSIAQIALFIGLLLL